MLGSSPVRHAVRPSPDVSVRADLSSFVAPLPARSAKEDDIVAHDIAAAVVAVDAAVEVRLGGLQQVRGVMQA
jgi:hypothetical protein